MAEGFVFRLGLAFTFNPDDFVELPEDPVEREEVLRDRAQELINQWTAQFPEGFPSMTAEGPPMLKWVGTVSRCFCTGLEHTHGCVYRSKEIPF